MLFPRHDGLSYRTNGGATLWVDRVKAGSASFTILPRRNLRTHFHVMADSVSHDLWVTAKTLFDGRGRPRLQCLQQALGRNDSYRGFLYLSNLWWKDPLYRTTLWIGAKALRVLLTETALEGQWSLAAYIPEAETQFSEQDAAASEEFRRAEMSGFQLKLDNPEEQARVDEWKHRRRALIHRDMRQFLRAGFRQEPETVYESTCFFVYAVPSQLMDQLLLSHEETMAIPILEKPTADEEQAGASYEAFQLLEMMKTWCSERLSLANEKLETQRFLASSIDHPRYLQSQSGEAVAYYRAQMQKMEDESRRNVILLEQMMQVASSTTTNDQGKDVLPRLREQHEQARQVLDERIPSQRQLIDESEQAIIEILRRVAEQQVTDCTEKLERLDERVRSETVAVITKAGIDIIESSHVLHACAFNLEPVYIRMLLQLIPEDANKRRHVMNALDRHGQTPLMAAARSSNYDSCAIGNRWTTCRTLIDLGADKNVVDLFGLTALGKYRRNVQDMQDLYVCMGRGRSVDAAAELEAMPDMEELLMPLRGPTVADNRVLEDAGGGFDDEEEEEDVDWQDEDDAMEDDDDND